MKWDCITLLNTYLEKNAKVGTSSDYQITMGLLEEPLIFIWNVLLSLFIYFSQFLLRATVHSFPENRAVPEQTPWDSLRAQGHSKTQHLMTVSVHKGRRITRISSLCPTIQTTNEDLNKL